MTAGEFARKYGISYMTVRAATFRTATRQNASWLLDYGEPELKKAVTEELAYKVEWHRSKLEKYERDLAAMRGKAAMG